MRRRVTAGRLGKLGLTLFALAGVFFSLFASVLDPVVSAALDEDVPAVEEAAADETSVPEEPEPEAPEPVLEEAAYLVRIHVVTGDGGALLAAAEPDAGDAADWAADYDWYTLDEAWEKVPYDISAAVTAELSCTSRTQPVRPMPPQCCSMPPLTVPGQWWPKRACPEPPRCSAAGTAAATI